MLEKTTDILMDELEQGKKICETLEDKNQIEINRLYQIRCVDCIKDDMKGESSGLFGDDTDEELDLKQKTIEDFKENSDPISDPLSDSNPDQKKLSKSEKSLQKPL